MSYVIYNEKTTRFFRVLRNGYWQDAVYKTKGAATAALNRIKAGTLKSSVTEEGDVWLIAEKNEFHAKIEKQETKRNLLTGIEFTQPVNTPLCCDPSSETYHSM